MHFAIIGAGWYGCHLAIELSKKGHMVVLYEQNDQIFSEISGTFGVRLHVGLHYPRSEETRNNCLDGMKEFMQRYPDLVVPHRYSVYGLGVTDAEGNKPRVTKEEFLKVVKESPNSRVLDPIQSGYQNLFSAYDVDEPSILIGDPLRQAFTTYLKEAGVEVVCGVKVQSIMSTDKAVVVSGVNFSKSFDKVINATGYQNFIPNTNDLPFSMQVIYQPCLGLIYKDKYPHSKPISFIVMDGFFPCLMPLTNYPANDRYILTHAKWTIMGSYLTPLAAKSVLAQVTFEWAKKSIVPQAQAEMNRFWPDFEQRFDFVGIQSGVIAKIATKTEHRSALTFEKDRVIHVFPGKINNIFAVEREVMALIANEQIELYRSYRYIKGGILASSVSEIRSKPTKFEINTANLNTFEELINKENNSQNEGDNEDLDYGPDFNLRKILLNSKRRYLLFKDRRFSPTVNGSSSNEQINEQGIKLSFANQDINIFSHINSCLVSSSQGQSLSFPLVISPLIKILASLVNNSISTAESFLGDSRFFVKKGPQIANSPNENQTFGLQTFNLGGL